jgi:hypothetical protein
MRDTGRFFLLPFAVKRPRRLQAVGSDSYSIFRIFLGAGSERGRIIPYHALTFFLIIIALAFSRAPFGSGRPTAPANATHAGALGLTRRPGKPKRTRGRGRRRGWRGAERHAPQGTASCAAGGAANLDWPSSPANATYAGRARAVGAAMHGEKCGPQK